MMNINNYITITRYKYSFKKNKYYVIDVSSNVNNTIEEYINVLITNVKCSKYHVNSDIDIFFIYK